MSIEAMKVHLEVWPVAADKQGIWLLSGRDALRSTLPVMADEDPDAEVKLLLAMHGYPHDRPGLAVGHFTSWHQEPGRMVTTYMAVIDCPTGFVRETWPAAEPVSVSMAQSVGPPPTHGSADPPDPRFIDVLLHGIGHLSDRMARDATIRAALPAVWRRHLAELQPTLAGMYQVEHRAA